MKPLFRCDYCDKIGTEDEILKHEFECIYNHTKRSCLTCKYKKELGLVNLSCDSGREIPAGTYYENCPCYVWDEKIHSSDNPVGTNSLFGGVLL